MIKVLLLAQYQQAAGRESVEMKAAGQSVAHVKSTLKENYNLRGLDDAQVTVNDEYKDLNTQLNDGDIIAFIPPLNK